LFFGLLFLVPESPRWLFGAGRLDEAHAILVRVGGIDNAEKELGAMRAPRREEAASLRDLLLPRNRRVMLVGIVLALLVQISGINTIIDYAPVIFRSTGWKMDAALFSTFIIGLTNLVFTVVSFGVIDRFGRKPLYITGSLGMTAALLLLTAAVVEHRFEGATVLALILLYLAFFCSCIGPVFWTLTPEILPNRVRGTAMTVPVLTQWIANAVVVLFFPLAFNQIGKAVTFGFLAAMSLAQALFTWFFLPETKNRPLEEIEEFWRAHVHAG